MFKRIGKQHSQDFVVAIRLQRPRVPVVGCGVDADGLALLDRDLSDRAANAMKSVDGFPSTRAALPRSTPGRFGRAERCRVCGSGYGTTEAAMSTGHLLR
jgi:hypothetical protein